MTLPEPIRSVGPTRATVAIGVLALALLLLAVAIIRTVPARTTTDVLAATEDGVDPDGDRPVGPADLPHAGLVAERTDAMRSVIASAAVGPATEGSAPPSDAFSPRPGDAGEGTPPRCAEWNRYLPRDLSPVTYRPASSGCLVARGVLEDPYFGRSMPYTAAHTERVAIDRIVSTDYAWRHGAAAWTPAQRRAFAEDPLNRLVVDARAARSKAGRGPSGWLPPDVAIRCAYAARFAEVVTAYGLTISPADREVARRQCAAV